MKKSISLALVLTIVLAFAVPAMAAAPAGFTGGTVVIIDKNGYNKFVGTEITANNSTKAFDNFSFIADNKTLNAWYINVTKDISGTLEAAYKVGSAYYIVTFDIDGPGKYWIGDSKGNNGINMVKIGVFIATPIHVHDYIPEVTLPTCLEQGYTTYTCECGDEYIDDYVPALDHDWDGIVTLPTCTEQGYTTYTCSRCGDEYVGDYEPALDHDWNGIITPPTCEEHGYTTYTCSRCADEYVGDYVPALDHDYIPVTTAPTCTEDGYTTWTCSRCADEYVDDYEPALGHVWVTDVAVTLTNPTCAYYDDGGSYDGRWRWSADINIEFTLSNGIKHECSYIQYIGVLYPWFADVATGNWVFQSWDHSGNFFPGLEICKDVAVRWTVRWTTTGGNLSTLEATLSNVRFEIGDDWNCE